MYLNPVSVTHKIDVERVLEDIRSGASDSTLMLKYTLSRKGLHSLFKKLEGSGFLKLLNPAVLLKDIRSGASREDLMKKYRLSPRGVQHLFDQLSAAGLKFPYNRNLKKHPPKKIGVSGIMQDIESGMDRHSLVAKYDISYKQLRKIFDRLERSGLVAKEDLDALLLQDEDSGPVWQPREFLRCHPLISLHVADVRDPRTRGAVVDLSEKGIGLFGMVTAVDESKTFKLLPTIIADKCRLNFTARCRWTGCCSPQMKLRSGFEITDIDDTGLNWLRELISTTTVCI